MKKYLQIILLTITLFGFGIFIDSATASAATVTWDGGSAVSHDWSEADNWDGDAVPVDGDDIVLNCVGSWGCATSVDMDLTVNSIHFVGTGLEAAETINPSGGFGNLVVMGDITSDTPGSDLSANIQLGTDIEIHNFLITGGEIDLNSFELMLTGTGKERSNGIGNPTGPDNALALLGQIIGDGDIIIDVETGTEVYMGNATPSTYTGITFIANGTVTDGRSDIIGGEWQPLGVDNYSQHMFGESYVAVDSGGKIRFFLSEGDSGGSIDNTIELVNDDPSSPQIEFINVTEDDSQVDIAVPNILLSSDNRFDALTYNGDLLIDLAGINNDDQYCLTYGEDNDHLASFQNGPDCSEDPVVDPPTDPPVTDPPTVPISVSDVPGPPNAGRHIAKNGLLLAVVTLPALAWFVRTKMRA